MSGFVQVYTGNGKGKTTAALGLAVRASGHGHMTFLAQFMKGMWYGELESIKNNWLIDVVQFGWEECIRKEEVNDTHRVIIQNGLEQSLARMLSGKYQMVILDEIIVSAWFGLVDESDILEFIKSKPEDIELILTGRYASDKLIEIADLVTEMKDIKHYYDRGVEAREGVEF